MRGGERIDNKANRLISNGEELTERSCKINEY